MTTNDVEALAEPPQSSFTIFQNSKGRILFDALLSLVHREGDDCTFLLDVPADMRSAVQKHLRLYRLRSKVGLDWMDGLAAWQVAGAGPLGDGPLGAGGAATARGADFESPDFALAVPDPRLPALGYRVYAAAGEGDGTDAASKPCAPPRHPVREVRQRLALTPSPLPAVEGRESLAAGTEEDFTTLRLLHGVAEGCAGPGHRALRPAAPAPHPPTCAGERWRAASRWSTRRSA